MPALQHYINHVAFVIDRSGSMASLSSKVVEVFDKQVAYLKQRSVEMNQETRVSVYIFGSNVECLVFDMDVMRVPSLKSHYRIDGQTALLDATAQALSDCKLLPQAYGDHAFLVYVLTDGQENDSNLRVDQFKSQLINLPENYTLVVQVPNGSGIAEAKAYGFPAGNIEKWDTTATGLERATESFSRSIDTYMTNRTRGVRSSSAFFTADLKGVSKTAVSKTADRLGSNTYMLLPVSKEGPIKEFVEGWTKADYRPGSAYYELTKPVVVQGYKNVILINRRNGDAFSGDGVRDVLGLPAHELKLAPGNHADWRIFIQSTSVNRKLVPGTQVLVMR